MQCRVKLFAVVKERVGADHCVVEVSEPATVKSLREALELQVPALASILANVRFAVDTTFAKEDTPLHSQSDIALIPPVSGG